MSHIDTKCVQAGWTPKNGEARVLPIYQSTTFKYDSAKTLGDLFDLNESGHFYTRLSNPTLEAVENKIAALEGGVGRYAYVIRAGGDHVGVFDYLPCRRQYHIYKRDIRRYIQPV